MKPSVRRPAGLLAVAAFALVALVGSAARSPGGDEPQTLHDAMEGMKDGLKAIGSALQSEGGLEQALEGCRRMEVFMLVAKNLEPTNLPEIEEARRPAHIAAFRADLARALQQVLELEIAVLEGRQVDALAMVRGKIFPLRDAAHDKYQPADERDEGDEDGDEGSGRRR